MFERLKCDHVHDVAQAEDCQKKTLGVGEEVHEHQNEGGHEPSQDKVHLKHSLVKILGFVSVY
jgi:hypothetical protein